MMRIVLWIGAGLGLLAGAANTEARGDDGEDAFNRKVRPILARHCFKCHGPDEKARKAKLRLDLRDEAIRPAESGEPAIVPGKADGSELIRRILSADDDEQMPPPHAKNPLSSDDKATLKKWVADGAEYRPHWAFVAPRQAKLPAVAHADWPRNEVDRLILARLEKEGLAPSPQADRSTLMRRLSLDLVGLPPTLEELDAFLADQSADAYEKAVDRLLASPHYGERWARRWLDLARYADTNGYEKDRMRSIWPYRDWVIQAINDDVPFDRFTIEQIAGDMLPRATVAQEVATGFHRNTMLNEEGGIDPLEFRFHAMTDRVATTGTVWLGLTVGCAQCHTHKFDPIPHREYYQFMALLNNADEPEMPVAHADIERQRREAEAKIDAMAADLPLRFPAKASKDDTRPEPIRRREHLDQKFQEWLDREAAATVRWRTLKPVKAEGSLPLLTIQDDGSVVASGDQSKSDTYTLSFRDELRGITAIRIEALPEERSPRRGPGRVYYEGPFGDFFLSEVTVTAGGKTLAIKDATESFSRGKGFGAAEAIDGDQQSGWSIDGGQGRPHEAVFRLAEPLSESAELGVRLLFERYYAAGLGRCRISVTSDLRPAIAREMPDEVEALLLTPNGERTEAQKAQLLKQFLLVAPELEKERAAIEKMRREIPAEPTTLVMTERPATNVRPTYRHNRGEYLQPMEAVDPGVLSVLHAMPTGTKRDRLAFARWLVARENPLVGRVTMNRQWAALFGRGIVASVQDFGYQGEPPSHPELLDWLAVEFAKRGWSMKAMHKLIVMSATYQQSSRVTPEGLAKDPTNVYLSRAPRVRLEGEMVRDQALRVAGLLSEKVGGQSVFPPQPANVTTEGAYGRLDWKVSTGEDRYRRGLYTFSKRTAPYAMFTTFDGPSGEVCVARRDVSNTPLQALTLLNDPVFVEVTQALGRSLASAPGGAEERVKMLFRRCLGRLPDETETADLMRYYEAQRSRFANKELDAVKVAGPGEAAVERAVWTAIARAVLNLDEFVVRG